MTTTELKLWLQNKIAEESGLPVDKVSFDEDFKNFNLDSLALVSMSFDLESAVGIEINPTVFIEFNTINKLAAWIDKQT